MTFARNLARTLRDEDGALDAEVLSLAFGATAIASGILVFFATGNLEWGFIGGGAAIPVQLVAMAARPTAMFVGGTGTLLCGAVAGVVTSLLTELQLAMAWPGWIAGGLVGLFVAWWVARAFRCAMKRLNAGSDGYRSEQ